MAKENNKKTVQNKDSAPKKAKNPLFIIAAAVICIGLLIGIAVGVASIILSATATVEYEGVRIDKKTAAYLISNYKNKYLAERNAEGVPDVADEPYFWQSYVDGTSTTYAEHFEKSAELYLRRGAVGAHLYDRYADMDKELKKSIEENAKEKLEFLYKTEGYEKVFEKDAETFGYNMKAYLKAAVLLYKYEQSCSAMFGKDGSGVASLADECNEYLRAAYAHVDLVFIRTLTTFEVDENGNRVKNPNGTYMKRLLTDDERAERVERIALLKRLVDEYNGAIPGDIEISPETIKAVATDYAADQSVGRIEKGYYLSAGNDGHGSEYVRSLLEGDELDWKTVVEKALTLPLDVNGNAYSYVTLKYENVNGTTEDILCFMYKSSVAQNAYEDAELSDFFGDFYSLAAPFAHRKLLDMTMDQVKVKKAFYKLEPVLIPKNNKHYL